MRPDVARRSDQHEIVAMDEFGFEHVAQHAFDLGARMALDELGLSAAVVREPACDLAAFAVQTRDDLAARERTLHIGHADGQQALAVGSELLRRAVVDHHMAAHLQVVGHPLLACGHARSTCDELRADRLARGEPHQHLFLATARDHRVRAAVRRALGRQDLGEHAASADARPCAARHRFEFGLACVGFLHERGSRVLARIGRIETALIGEDDEGVAFDQVRHERAQRVVVAELDFVGDHGVVLVDDRHHAQTQQREQRGTRVQIALAVGEVGVREQDLRRADVVFGETAFVDLREPHLPDRRRCLQFVDLTRSLAPAEALHALGNRARTDEHDFLALRAQGRDLRGPTADGRMIEPTAVVGDEARTDFHYQTPGIGDDGTHAARSPN
ncbi:hypothetical protein PT2222_280081 [Paraburkholderia tropica]